MRIKRIIDKQILLKISFLLLSSLIFSTIVDGQIKQAPNESPDNPIFPITACEEWISRIGEALFHWNKNKKGSVIIIARLGDGESSRQINLKRIKTLKEYISNLAPEIKPVFAEGWRVKGNGGTIEIYVEGELIDALRVGPKVDIPLRGCNP